MLYEQSFKTIHFNTNKHFIPYLIEHNDLSSQHINPKSS